MFINIITPPISTKVILYTCNDISDEKVVLPNGLNYNLITTKGFNNVTSNIIENFEIEMNDYHLNFPLEIQKNLYDTVKSNPLRYYLNSFYIMKSHYPDCQIGLTGSREFNEDNNSLYKREILEETGLNNDDLNIEKWFFKNKCLILIGSDDLDKIVEKYNNKQINIKDAYLSGLAILQGKELEKILNDNIDFYSLGYIDSEFGKIPEYPEKLEYMSGFNDNKMRD